jgi:hypothetical protein
MKMTRTQLSLDREMLRRAQRRASEMGISLAEYIRRLVAQDLGERAPSKEPSLVFDLGGSGGSNIAEHKQAMLADAFSTEAS